MVFDLETQYDNIYRYCYFKLHHQQTAEDITQETFLRYWERYHPMPSATAVRYLYIIARNLCIDEYRRLKPLGLDESIPNTFEEDRLLTGLTVQSALYALSAEEQELLLLRYVNNVPVGIIGKLLGLSRFAVYRRLKSASNHFQSELNKEGIYDALEN